MDFTAGTLHFDLAVPLESEERKSDTATLLAAWREDPMLQQCVADLHEENNQQTTVGGVSVFLMRFAGMLPHKGG